MRGCTSGSGFTGRLTRRRRRRGSNGRASRPSVRDGSRDGLGRTGILDGLGRAERPVVGREAVSLAGSEALLASGLLLHALELVEQLDPLDATLLAALEAVWALVGRGWDRGGAVGADGSLV